MKKYSKRCALLALMLAALLMTACVSAKPAVKQESAAKQEPVSQVTAEPAAPVKTAAEPTAEPASPLPEGAVEVGTVDELLAALASNTTIYLKPGQYDLSTAADYGREDVAGNYAWELVLGGAQLNVSGLKGLRIVGGGQATIVAQPRYAEVLRFSDCWDLSLDGLTLGHTLEPSGCVGGVLSLYACDNVSVENCRLYGCGVLGVTASACESVTIRGTRIDDCSSGAVYAYASGDMRLEDCEIMDCGLGKEGPAGSLFFLDRCKGFALVNSEITGNRAEGLLLSSWSDQVAVLGSRVEQNHFQNAVFDLQGRAVTVDKCAFSIRATESFFARGSGGYAVSPEGKKLTTEDLTKMELGRAEYTGPVDPVAAQLEKKELPDGRTEVHVTDAEELLSAIAPNTTIVLDAGIYDLSATMDYGGPGGDWYFWISEYDGYTLQITGVTGLSIVGAGKGETVLMADPRYASVIRFQGCDDVSLKGFTAGHSEAPGFCTGNVLDFIVCENVSVEDCGLYGCGVLGIWGASCTGFTVKNTDIYECASGAAEFSGCSGVVFEGCSIYDCDEGQNYITLDACSMAWDGQLIPNGVHEFLYKSYVGEVRFS